MKNFVVYTSSAGSGKTYTLVKEYIKIVLSNPASFRNILAITFTNKAANEMKFRVLRNLIILSKPVENRGSDIIKFLLPEIISETGLDETVIAKNADKVLTLILHQYSDFAVSTIDSFIYKIIKSFSYDIHLPFDFDVELDTDKLIAGAVDYLLGEVGIDEQLTKLLIHFTEAKADMESDWHIEKDLQNFGRNLMDEGSYDHLKRLKEVSLGDFFSISSILLKEIKIFENQLNSYATAALSLVEQKGLVAGAFFQSRSGILKYFEYITLKNFKKLDPNSFVLKTINEDRWYSTSATIEQKNAIDEIKLDLRNIFDDISSYSSKHYEEYLLFRLLYRNIYPLALLNEIGNIIDEIKTYNRKIPISEFNKRIAEIVLNEPVPFIYERIGEKYAHFLIDEFQDTSVLQWMNFLPLIDNALANGNFNMVVGDAKQSIYRWRNGDVEQFVRLPEIFNKKETRIDNERQQSLQRNFKQVLLDRNFRSFAEIIQFNNDFFEAILDKFPSYVRHIYSDHKQKFDHDKRGGYVNIEFYDKENKEKEEINFSEYNLQRVIELIQEIESDEFSLSDIAVICRSNDEGSRIARFLLKNGIDVISSESLLLKNSSDVKFLVSFLNYLINPCDLLQAEIVNYLIINELITGYRLADLTTGSAHQNNTENENNLIGFLTRFGIRISASGLLKLSVYELTEELIRIFNLNKQVDPYVQFYMDAVFEYTSKENGGILDYLRWWEEKKDKLSIQVPEGSEAVTIMTIHKAKGLEFPVVIYPFAKLSDRMSRKYLWVDVDNSKIAKLSTSLLSTTVDMKQTVYNSDYLEEYEKSLLDMINMLYVVLTRPVVRLYVISELPSDNSKSINVSTLLALSLKKTGNWIPGQLVYSFGSKVPYMKPVKKEKSAKYLLKHYISLSW
ncbi:MAG: UvrD-helicase domain-containing protein, partial [Bacteroidales bacterium]|nr:UvrD-helicase domain-containing protein [Bacteroidales bacterium]